MQSLLAPTSDTGELQCRQGQRKATDVLSYATLDIQTRCAIMDFSTCAQGPRARPKRKSSSTAASRYRHLPIKNLMPHKGAASVAMIVPRHRDLRAHMYAD